MWVTFQVDTSELHYGGTHTGIYSINEKVPLKIMGSYKVLNLFWKSKWR